MSNCPYEEKNSDRIIGILKMYSRLGPYPLDSSSVFNTYEEMMLYINEEGSHAYPGQVIAVANGTVDPGNGDTNFSLYVVKSNKTAQEIGAGSGSSDNTSGIQSVSDEFEVNDGILYVRKIPQSKVDGLLKALEGKVDKVEGKGLSTNDFSDELKAKLENLPENINNLSRYDTYSDFPVTGNTDTLYIDNSTHAMYTWDDTKLKYYSVSAVDTAVVEDCVNDVLGTTILVGGDAGTNN